MIGKKTQFVQLNSKKSSLIIKCEKDKTPKIIYWGKRINETTSIEMIEVLNTRQEAKCSVVNEAPISLSPLLGEGFTGSPGIEISNHGNAWSLGGKLSKIDESEVNEITLECLDDIRNIKIIYCLKLDFFSNVLSATTKLVNNSTENIMVNWCAAPTIPIPNKFTKLISFEGRWSNEFQRKNIDIFLGSFIRENRKGKTSHDSFPGLILHTDGTSEHSGECYGFHLGWSGNHKSRVELLAEGRVYAQFGELLLPSEIILKPADSYTSPVLYAAYSNKGLTKLSQYFHQFVRKNILSENVIKKPRLIHYNTWEGIYFDHNIETLKQLADQVAKLGVERFVLDDGWFKGRRADNAGLGDWVVDKNVYPEGLSPIINYVTDLGMEFGLWFEPEMINPDSDLYRVHPDWVLSSQGNEQLQFRNQLVLDFSRNEVVDYIYQSIDQILIEYPKISYIKWDMNRDINHAGNFEGRPAVHTQTHAFYNLIDRIKREHPHLEIESCSSGGARIDYGVLAHTDRVWTSDSNDALDRLSIQKGCSFFFPAEIMGAHIGPRNCHITGRQINMEMRAATAFFGHMGIEMDPRELTTEERKLLSHAISLHKIHRQLIHHGDLIRLDSDEYSINFGIINNTKTHALFSYNCIKETQRTLPSKYYFNGLNKNKIYNISIIWPLKITEYSTSILSQIEKTIFTGEVLMQHGMQLPILFPQSSIIFELKEYT